MTFADIDAFATSLSGVTVGRSWGHRTWMVGGRGFAWERPFTKADIRRFGDEKPPAGEILGVRVESLDAKEALLEMALPGFFSIAHFEGFPGLLIALRKARARDVRGVIADAHAAVSELVAGRKRGRRRPKR